MKRISKHFAWLLLLLQCSSVALAESEKWQKVAEQWRKADEEWTTALKANKDGKSDPARLEAVVRELKPLLKIKNEVGPQWRNMQEEARFDLMDWKLANAWAAAGNYKKSLHSLRAQAAQPGVFLLETRNPNYFALDVFKLHAEIMAHTGKVADIPYSGYQVFAGPSSKEMSRYVFVWEPEGEEVGSITVEGVAGDEQRQEITLFECGPDKHCRYGDKAQVVSKRGKLKVSTASRHGSPVLVLSGVTKVLEFVGEFEVPHVHPSPQSKIELRLDLKDGLEQPLEASRGKPSTGGHGKRTYSK